MTANLTLWEKTRVHNGYVLCQVAQLIKKKRLEQNPELLTRDPRIFPHICALQQHESQEGDPTDFKHLQRGAGDRAGLHRTEEAKQ